MTTTEFTVEAETNPLAALIGADPWSVRRMIAVSLALVAAGGWQRWLAAVRAGEIPTVDLLSELVWTALKILIVAVALRLARHTLTAAVIAGLGFAAIATVWSRMTEPMYAYSTGNALLTFVAIVAWVAVTAFTLRLIRSQFIALIVSQFVYIVVRVIAIHAIYSRSFALDGLGTGTLTYAVVTGALIWVAVRVTPTGVTDEGRADTVETPTFGVPPRR